MKVLNSFAFALVASLSLLGSASADRAPKSPDFVNNSPSRGVDSSLMASDAKSSIEPIDDISFPTDSATMLPAVRAQVVTAAKWLAEHPDVRMVLEGHADSSGAAIYNEDLATRRLVNVRNHLIRAGVAADRVILVVFGESEAKLRTSPIDRRVIMYGTKVPVREIIDGSLERRKAISVIWTNKATLFTETRANHRPTTISSR